MLNGQQWNVSIKKCDGNVMYMKQMEEILLACKKNYVYPSSILVFVDNLNSALFKKHNFETGVLGVKCLFYQSLQCT